MAFPASKKQAPFPALEKWPARSRVKEGPLGRCRRRRNLALETGFGLSWPCVWTPRKCQRVGAGHGGPSCFSGVRHPKLALPPQGPGNKPERCRRVGREVSGKWASLLGTFLCAEHQEGGRRAWSAGVPLPSGSVLQSVHAEDRPPQRPGGPCGVQGQRCASGPWSSREEASLNQAWTDSGGRVGGAPGSASGARRALSNEAPSSSWGRP